MLTTFYAHNYKSLVNFSLPLRPGVTVIAGANGAGKTSACEAMDMALRLATDRPQELLGKRDQALIRNKWLSTKRLVFKWDMTLESSAPAEWHIEVNKRKHWGVASEWAKSDGKSLLERKTTKIRVYDEQGEHWDTENKVLPSYLSTLYEGSERSFPTLWEIRRQVVGRYIPFLNPVFLRARSRLGEIGPQGENFARYLYEFRTEAPREFAKALKRVQKIFPRVTDVKPVRSRYGWTEVQIVQRVGRGKASDVFKADQVNDGLLRLLALATAPYALEGLRLLIVEEPENGMHPRLLQSTLELLRELPAQVVVTTHSPVLLNFARSDEVVVMRWKRGTEGPEAARFTDLEGGMKRMGYLDIGDVLYNIDDDRLFRGWSAR